MATIDILRNEKDLRTLGAGQIIFNEGDPGDQMFAVIEGEVEIHKEGRTLETIQAGGIFGEMALIDQQARSATAVAKTDCKVAAITSQRFMYLITQVPYFAIQVMQILTRRVRQNMES